MRVRPADGAEGLPPELAASRARLASAAESGDDGAMLSHLRAWRERAVAAENGERERPGLATSAPPTRYPWFVGSRRVELATPRFETACVAFACGRTLFAKRRYREAHAAFGLALEESALAGPESPLTPEACGARRLRCLVRAQRARCCELDPRADAAELLEGASWLAAALRAYSELDPRAARREPLEAGEALVCTALAVLHGDRDRALAALRWTCNPFADEAREVLGGRGPVPSRRGPAPRGTPAGSFFWSRFLSSAPYAF
jgi:hypothetical protein